MTLSNLRKIDVNTLTDAEVRIIERRLRRVARRQGLAIRKSRSRTVGDPTYGGYMVIDARTGFVECGADCHGFSMDLELLVNYLT